jgi:hypothetical protein
VKKRVANHHGGSNNSVSCWRQQAAWRSSAGNQRIETLARRQAAAVWLAIKAASAPALAKNIVLAQAAIPSRICAGGVSGRRLSAICGAGDVVPFVDRQRF